MLQLLPTSTLIYIVLTTATIKDSLDLAKRQLDSTEQKISELSQLLAHITLQEQSSLQRIEILQEKIVLTERALHQLESQITRYNREINELNTQLADATKQQEICQQELKKRLTNIYKYSKFYRFQAFLTSSNLPEFYRRILTLRIVSRADRKLLEEIKRLKYEIVAKQNALESAVAQQEKLKQEAQEKKQALMKDKETETKILNRIRSEKAAKSTLQQELMNAAQNLGKLITQLQLRANSQATDRHYLELHKGKLPWPVRGPVIAQFGVQTHPRYHTKINNFGIDIQVKETTPVRVIATGKVVYADRFIGYGNLVIVDHGGGYFSLYGNLSTVNTIIEAEVGAETTIGMVDSFLHFEIRKDGQPLNPKDWLE